MSKNFQTIHIFGFGTVQVIDKDLNLQCSIADVQAEADACIDEIWSKKPADVTLTKEYHAINIFNNYFADWLPKIKGEKSYRTKYLELNDSLFEALANKVILLQNKP